MTAAALPETGVQLRELTGAINLGNKSHLSGVRELQQLRIKMGARELFGVETLPNGEWKEPNFEELKEITDRMDWPGARSKALQDKTAKYKDIIEGRLTSEHLKIMGKIIGDMPGMVLALAKEAGISDPSTVAARLKDGTFVSTNLRQMVERLGKDNNLSKRLKTALAGFTISSEDAGQESSYKALRDEVERKTKDLDERKRALDEVVHWHDDWEKINPAQVADFKANIGSYDKYMSYLKATALPEELKRNTVLDEGDADSYIALLNTYAPTPAIDVAIANATRIKILYGYPYFNQDNMRRMRLYLDKDRKYADIDREQTPLSNKVKSFEELKVRRKKTLDEYGHKIDIALETAVKRYYNEILLEQARKLAEAEAQYKEGDRTKEAKVDGILKKYLTYGFFRFNRKGEPKGFDHKWIKKSAKAIKRNGPEGMARLMMERVIKQRRRLSPQLRAEIDNLLKEINPENPERPWEMVSSEYLRKIGQEKTPKLLGYAYAKNYWWDRLRFRQSQAEFIAANYNEDFWTKVFANRDDNKEMLSKLLGTAVVNMDNSQFKELIRKKLGENSVEFTKKLLKVAPYALAAGALGAGIYFGLPAIGITGDSIMSAAGQAGSSIGSAAGELGNTIGTAAGEVGQAVGGALGAAQTAGQGAANAIGGALGSAGQGIGDAFAGGPAGVGQAIGETLKNTGGAIVSVAQGTANAVDQTTQGIGQGVQGPQGQGP